jgi:hypothetical protein
MTASSQEDAEARSLFKKHFEKFELDTYDKVNDSDLVYTFDLEEFRRDLTRCPRIAFQTCGVSCLTALQYVLILPGLTAQIVEEILTINPEAIEGREAVNGWNTFQWVDWAGQLDNLSADILRVLLERGGRQYIIEEKAEENECPLFYLLNREMHDGPRVILETSRHAVALVLAFHFMDKETILDEVVDFALERAIALEKEGRGIFTLTLQYREDEVVCCLLREMFRHVDSANTGLFHRYLQAYIQGREGYFQNQEKPHDAENLDALSVTCCVLSLMANFLRSTPHDRREEEDEEDTVFDTTIDLEQLWRQYLGKSLVPELMEHLNQGNLEAFRNKLQDLVRNREGYCEERGWDQISFDESSLTYCVLYLIAALCFSEEQGSDSADRNDDDSEGGSDDNNEAMMETFNPDPFWQQYLESCSDDVKIRTRNGDHVLEVALGMGHSWYPVLRDIIKRDPGALQIVDAKEKDIPLIVEGLFEKDWGDKSTHISCMFELFRANPSVICLPNIDQAETTHRKRRAVMGSQARKRRKRKS